MKRRPQRGTNRGRSGMVARSTDGHKTNASLGAEHLERVGMVMLYDNGHQRGHLQALFCDFFIIRYFA